MEAKACAKHIRISPRKARQVVDLIRGKSVQEAYSILKFTPHKGSAIVTKVLKSAVANAEHNYDMDAEKAGGNGADGANDGGASGGQDSGYDDLAGREEAGQNE